MKKEWFASWFDSPFYHILYKNRDDEEAQQFISNLIQHIHLKKNAKVMDLACGKGRHARMLHQEGLRVLGVDLSPNSISAAKKLSRMDFHLTFMICVKYILTKNSKQFSIFSPALAISMMSRII